MNPLFILVGLVALLLAATLIFPSLRKRFGMEFLANGALVNITPKGRATRLGDAAFTQRYLIGKAGSDASHIALAGVGDLPLGVVTDQTPSTDASGDLSYPLPLNFLGLNEDTERVIASAAMSVGDLVTTAASGLVKTLPTSGGGTAFVIGRALSAAGASGDQVELLPCFPYQVTIAS